MTTQHGKFFDAKYLGQEPNLANTSITNSVLADAYNWYSHFYNADEAKEFVIEYLKSRKTPSEAVEKIEKAQAYNLRTIGWNCRLLSRGAKLPKDVLGRMIKRLDQLSNTEMVEPPDDPVPPGPSIQDRIRNREQELIADIDDFIDDFIEKKSEVKIGDWLRQKNVSPTVAGRLGKIYQPLYSELHDAYTGRDDQLKEAYSTYKSSELRKYMEYVKSIVVECETRAQVLKVRKPRKKKEKPAASLVKNLQYKDKDETYKITSIQPSDIIGSSQLWVFNTKTRNLSVFNAMGPTGLSIKGTTITGFDDKTSITKKVRKPDKVLPDVVSSGKVLLRQIMDKLNSTDTVAKGRINKDVVLLRYVR